MERDVAQVIGIGCAGILALSLVCGGAGFLMMRGRHAAAPEDDGPGQVSPPSIPGHPRPDPFAQPAAPSHDVRANRSWSRPVHVKDRHHVDVTELFGQAAAVATELQPGAVFYEANIFGLKGGMLDLDDRDAKGSVSFDFELGGTEAGKPPGQDKFEVRVSVILIGDKLSADASPHGAMHLHADGFFGGPVPVQPRCTSRRAFEALVASANVPSNTVGRFMYREDHSSHHVGWTLYVDGHDELRHTVDAKTCEVLDGKSAASPAASHGRGKHRH